MASARKGCLVPDSGHPMVPAWIQMKDWVRLLSGITFILVGGPAIERCDMETAELIEAAGIYYGLTVEVLSFYLTATSGYLIVAYLAGNTLTKSQIFIISTLYIGMASLAAYGATVWTLRGVFFAFQQAEIDASIPMYANYVIPICLGLFLFGGIFASMKFMWDVRHPKSG